MAKEDVPYSNYESVGGVFFQSFINQTFFFFYFYKSYNNDILEWCSNLSFHWTTITL